jgi:hypothetical protein
MGYNLLTMFNKYFLPMFLLIIVIAVLHFLAIKELYYWSIWWYDIMMHFLGGLWVAFFVLWFNSWIPLPISPNTLLRVVVAVIFVGILWEVYELVFGMTFVSDDGYFIDTIQDFIMDTLGGIVGWFITRRFISNKQNLPR